MDASAHLAGHVCVFGIAHHIGVPSTVCVKRARRAGLVRCSTAASVLDSLRPRSLRRAELGAQVRPAVVPPVSGGGRGSRPLQPPHEGDRLIADTSIPSVSVWLEPAVHKLQTISHRIRARLPRCTNDLHHQEIDRIWHRGARSRRRTVDHRARWLLSEIASELELHIAINISVRE